MSDLVRTTFSTETFQKCDDASGLTGYKPYSEGPPPDERGAGLPKGPRLEEQAPKGLTPEVGRPVTDSRYLSASGTAPLTGDASKLGGTAGLYEDSSLHTCGGAGPFFYSHSKEEFEMAGTVTCVVCEGTVALPENCGLGEILVCGDCGTELEVVALEPIRAEEAPQVQEDWGE